MICLPCCKGNPEGCLGKVRHWSYCDNQHKGGEGEQTEPSET